MTDQNDTPDIAADADAAPSRNPAKLGLVALAVETMSHRPISKGMSKQRSSSND